MVGWFTLATNRSDKDAEASFKVLVHAATSKKMANEAQIKQLAVKDLSLAQNPLEYLLRLKWEQNLILCWLKCHLCMER
ncbi:MAG: hypothetical protein CM1200mP30_20100 [Pseudomonadota bacterium]|nr:MAG: hypothetical protein CM1200mP30_20100 [Pseudomonadota bacterium]